jgi:hypothetical protein
MNIWIVSTFGLLQIMLRWTLVYKYQFKSTEGFITREQQIQACTSRWFIKQEWVVRLKAVLMVWVYNDKSVPGEWKIESSGWI